MSSDLAKKIMRGYKHSKYGYDSQSIPSNHCLISHINIKLYTFIPNFIAEPYPDKIRLIINSFQSIHHPQMHKMFVGHYIFCL